MKHHFFKDEDVKFGLGVLIFMMIFGVLTIIYVEFPDGWIVGIVSIGGSSSILFLDITGIHIRNEVEQ